MQRNGVVARLQLRRGILIRSQRGENLPRIGVLLILQQQRRLLVLRRGKARFVAQFGVDDGGGLQIVQRAGRCKRLRLHRAHFADFLRAVLVVAQGFIQRDCAVVVAILRLLRRPVVVAQTNHVRRFGVIRNSRKPGNRSFILAARIRNLRRLIHAVFQQRRDIIVICRQLIQQRRRRIEIQRFHFHQCLLIDSLLPQVVRVAVIADVLQQPHCFLEFSSLQRLHRRSVIADVCLFIGILIALRKVELLGGGCGFSCRLQLLAIGVMRLTRQFHRALVIRNFLQTGNGGYRVRIVALQQALRLQIPRFFDERCAVLIPVQRGQPFADGIVVARRLHFGG